MNGSGRISYSDLQGGLGNGCGPTLMMYAFIGILLLMLLGCRTVKERDSERENTIDSIRVEYKEKIVKVPVTVYVEVPVETKEKMTRDSASHLETMFAVSDAAMVWIDGVPFLRHSLGNKPQKIAKTDTLSVTEKETNTDRIRRVTYTKTVIREKELSRWDRFKVGYGGYAIGISIFFFIILVMVLIRRLRRKPDAFLLKG